MYFHYFATPVSLYLLRQGPQKPWGKNDFNFLRYRLIWMETGKPHSKLQIRLQKSKIVWPILWIGNVGRRCNLSKYSELHSQNRKLWASTYAGLSSLGVPGVPWHPHFLAGQLTLSQPRGADYAHQIILAPPDL